MECIVTATENESKQSNSTAAATTSTQSTSDVSAANAKKKKANTPGAVARERAAARKAAQGSSSSSSSSSSKSASTTSSTPDSIFSAPRKSRDQSGKVSLLDDDEDWFLPKAEAVLEEIFRRFDSHHQPFPMTDSAQSLPKREELYWEENDLQSFALATNGRKFTKDELNEVRMNLEHDDKGRLTCQGFMCFYHLQTTSHPDETWKDLKKLGYDKELKLKYTNNQ